MKEKVTIEIDEWWDNKRLCFFAILISKYLSGGYDVLSDNDYINGPSPIYHEYRTLGPVYFRWTLY